MFCPKNTKIPKNCQNTWNSDFWVSRSQPYQNFPGWYFLSEVHSVSLVCRCIFRTQGQKITEIWRCQFPKIWVLGYLPMKMGHFGPSLYGPIWGSKKVFEYSNIEIWSICKFPKFWVQTKNFRFFDLLDPKTASGGPYKGSYRKYGWKEVFLGFFQNGWNWPIEANLVRFFDFGRFQVV